MSEQEKQTIVEKVKVITQKIAVKKAGIWGIIGVLAIIAGIVGVKFFSRTKADNNQYNPMFSVSGNDAAAEYVTAGGTTSLGYTMDEFEPDYIETELYIEEVYLSSGDEVRENTPVFKISQESVEEAREELEEKKEEASLTYRAGLISYEQSKINAKYTYDTVMLEGQQAEAVYLNALKEAEEKLQMAKDDVTETEKNIEEYQNAYTSYYYDYHLDGYKERYEQNNSYYHTFLGEYGFKESDLNGSGMTGSLSSGGGNSGQNQGDIQGKDQIPQNDGNQKPEGQQPGNTEDSNSVVDGSGTETKDEDNTNKSDNTASESEGNTNTGDDSIKESDKETNEGDNNVKENNESTNAGDDSIKESDKSTNTGNDNIKEGNESTNTKDDSTSGNESAIEGISNTNAEITPTSENNNREQENTTENSTTDNFTQENKNPAETELVLSLFSDSNTTLSRLTTSTSLGDGLSLMSVSKTDTSDENYSRRLKTIQQMKKNMENSQTYYYKAWDEYESSATKAASQVPQLKLTLETLKADLTEAETTYQLEVLEAETEYKKSLAQTELAQSDYNAAVQKAEDELEKLKDEKTEAQENLEEFEALLGDGYFYTKNAGTIMMVGTRRESNLQGGSMVVAYRNAEDISVTVSVSQDDIHKLSVGDSAQVMVEEYGTYEGKIAYLNPVSDSASRTNITYEVIVDLDGENIENLKENLTATVIFGYEVTR